MDGVKIKTAKINVDDSMRQLELPNMTLWGRLKSLNISVRWLLDQNDLHERFTQDELHLIFKYGCSGFNLESVIYEKPDIFFDKLVIQLGRNFPTDAGFIQSVTFEELVADMASVSRVLSKVKCLNSLDIFYLIEWVVNQFLVKRNENEGL
jgi:hypothetical protein